MMPLRFQKATFDRSSRLDVFCVFRGVGIAVHL